MGRLLLLAPGLLGLVACDDTTFSSGGGGEPPVGADWCAVQEIIASECVGCHGGDNPSGELSLEGDAHATLMAGYVVAGNKTDSYLYRKVSGTQTEAEKGVMPPGGPVASIAETVGAWIDAGATSTCEGGGDSDSPVDTSVPDPGWCAVQSAVNSEGACLNCHSGVEASAGLDLATGAYEKLVGQPSAGFDGRFLVVPYYPSASLLYRKLGDTQSADEGSSMPLGGSPLSAETLALVHAWIEAGALPETCE